MSARVSLGILPHRGPRPSEDATPLGDAALVERVREGDVDAFQTLFQMYYAPLHHFVVGLVRDRALAEECVQDVLHQVWLLGPRWQLHGSVSGYLYTAARNQALNHLKHRQVVARWTAEVAGDVAPSGMGQGPEPTDAACRRHELTAATQTILDGMPERRRTVVVLRIQHGLKNPEIASVLGISIKNVERHLKLAFRTLRTELAAFF